MGGVFVLVSTRGLVPARAGSYSLAKSARATYAAATTAAPTASGGRRSGAEEAGRSAFGGVAQRFAGLVASSFFASFTASTCCRWSRTLSTRSARDDAKQIFFCAASVLQAASSRGIP